MSRGLRVTALSISPFARAWLGSTDQARVLHVFENACNLISGAESLVSLVSPGVRNGPFTVVVPIESFSDRVQPDAPVDIEGGLLRAGSMVVDTERAENWNPRPGWMAIRERSECLSEHTEELREALRRRAAADGLAALVVSLQATGSRFQERLLEEARPAARMLGEGMRVGDPVLCREGAASLAGLGGGLTPDGDDLLLGCILAAWAGFGRGEGCEMASVIAEEACPRTGVVSRSWLSAAARGECAEAWHDLFEALLAGRVTAIRGAAEGLIGMGHSSGASALAGFLLPVSTEGACA